MSEPEYTKGKRIREDGRKVHCDNTEIAEYFGYSEDIDDVQDINNTRLSAASDNAVLELAEHLGCNAVTLAERLEGGGLVRMVEALTEAEILSHEAGKSGVEWRKRFSAALSHLTPAQR